MTTTKKTTARSKSANKGKSATTTKRIESGRNSGKKGTSAPGTRQSRRAKPKSATKRVIKPAPKASASKSTKSSRVLRLLSRRNGATLSELMVATGWQAHSVRGFLSGTVRKRLNMPLTAHVVDGERWYRIDVGDSPKGAS